MSEKPLHVRVAEALGCAPVARDGKWICPCKGPGPVKSLHELPAAPRHVEIVQRYRGIGSNGEVARYDLSWFALGPYIERLGIGLDRNSSTWIAFDIEQGWDCIYESWNVSAEGPTPLLAVCNFILATMGVRE